MKKLKDWLMAQMKRSKRMLHYIKLFAGCYLVYLCKSMFDEYTGGTAGKVYVGFGIFFGICGVFFAALSIYALVKGYYLENQPSDDDEAAAADEAPQADEDYGDDAEPEDRDGEPESEAETEESDTEPGEPETDAEPEAAAPEESSGQTE